MAGNSGKGQPLAMDHKRKENELVPNSLPMDQRPRVVQSNPPVNKSGLLDRHFLCPYFLFYWWINISSMKRPLKAQMKPVFCSRWACWIESVPKLKLVYFSSPSIPHRNHLMYRPNRAEKSMNLCGLRGVLKSGYCWWKLPILTLVAY